MELGIILQNQDLVVDSLSVADVFNKEHKIVLRDIKKCIAELEALKNGGYNFVPTSQTALDSYFSEGSYKDSQGKDRPLYYMNQKGFTLLVMGYTGQRAFEYKVAYIEEFERMRIELEEPKKALDEPTPEELREIIVSKLAECEFIHQPKDEELGYDYFAMGIYGLLRYYGHSRNIPYTYIRDIRPKVIEMGLAEFEEIVNYCAVKKKLKLAYVRATMEGWQPSEVEAFREPLFRPSLLD